MGHLRVRCFLRPLARCCRQHTAISQAGRSPDEKEKQKKPWSLQVHHRPRDEAERILFGTQEAAMADILQWFGENRERLYEYRSVSLSDGLKKLDGTRVEESKRWSKFARFGGMPKRAIWEWIRSKQPRCNDAVVKAIETASKDYCQEILEYATGCSTQTKAPTQREARPMCEKTLDARYQTLGDRLTDEWFDKFWNDGQPCWREAGAFRLEAVGGIYTKVVHVQKGSLDMPAQFQIKTTGATLTQLYSDAKAEIKRGKVDVILCREYDQHKDFFEKLSKNNNQQLQDMATRLEEMERSFPSTTAATSDSSMADLCKQAAASRKRKGPLVGALAAGIAARPA